MSYREKILQAQALLQEAQEVADAAGDYATGDEVGYALASCRSAEIMAGGFATRTTGRTVRTARPAEISGTMSLFWSIGRASSASP